MKLAIYDMDKTITGKPSWLPWLVFYARTEAPWRLLLLPLLLVPTIGFMLGLLDRKDLKQATQRMMMGRRVDEARIDRAARAFADTFGAKYELKGALAQIAADREAGWDIMVATASCEYYVRHLASRWGVGRVVATMNGRDGYYVLNRIDGPNCYDAAKLALVLKALPEGVERTRFYTDHASDLPTLLWSDEPVAANPSPALAKIAAQNDWEVVNWR